MSQKFSVLAEFRQPYVPNPKPKYTKPPSIPALINLKGRWHHDLKADYGEEDGELMEILNFEKELEQTNSIKIDLGQAEMERIIHQMRSMNGSVVKREVQKTKIAGIEIPRYCDYLQGKTFK
jgi:hypothetical protein